MKQAQNIRSISIFRQSTDMADLEGVGGDVELGTEKVVIAFGSTIVQSVSWLILLTPRRLRRTYAVAYSAFHTVCPKV